MFEKNLTYKYNMNFSASEDGTIQIYDVDAGKSKCSQGFGEVVCRAIALARCEPLSCYFSIRDHICVCYSHL